MSRTVGKQQAGTARLERKVESYEEQLALRGTLVFCERNRGDRRVRAGSSSSGSRGGSLKNSKESGKERSRECDCSIAQYIKSMFGL